MRPEMFVMLSGSLTFGVPLILALHQLAVLRRSGNGEGGGWRREHEPEHPPKPLPPCLLDPLGPHASVRGPRVMEPV